MESNPWRLQLTQILRETGSHSPGRTQNWIIKASPSAKLPLGDTDAPPPLNSTATWKQSLFLGTEETLSVTLAMHIICEASTEIQEGSVCLTYAQCCMYSVERARQGCLSLRREVTWRSDQGSQSGMKPGTRHLA